jgi:hypothetical protein
VAREIQTRRLSGRLLDERPTQAAPLFHCWQFRRLPTDGTSVKVDTLLFLECHVPDYYYYFTPYS